MNKLFCWQKLTADHNTQPVRVASRGANWKNAPAATKRSQFSPTLEPKSHCVEGSYACAAPYTRATDDEPNYTGYGLPKEADTLRSQEKRGLTAEKSTKAASLYIVGTRAGPFEGEK